MTPLVLGLLAVLLAGPVPALMARVPAAPSYAPGGDGAVAERRPRRGAGRARRRALPDHQQRARRGARRLGLGGRGRGAGPDGARARPAAAQRSPDRHRPACAATTSPRPGRPARAASTRAGVRVLEHDVPRGLLPPGAAYVARRRLRRRARPARAATRSTPYSPTSERTCAPATTWSSRPSTCCTAPSRAGCPAAPPCSRCACWSRCSPTRPPLARPAAARSVAPSSPSPRLARPHSTAASPWRPPARPATCCSASSCSATPVPTALQSALLLALAVLVLVLPTAFVVAPWLSGLA